MVSLRLASWRSGGETGSGRQMRELDLDVVLDLDIRLYEEKEEMLLKDIYSNSCQITPEKNEMGYDRLIARNVCKTEDWGGKYIWGSRSGSFRSAIPREWYS